MIGRKIPRPAAPTPAPQPPDRHRPKPGLIGALVLTGLAREFVPAHRTHRRALVSLLLRRFLQKFALQSLGLPKNFGFQMAQGLVTGPHAPRQASRQTRRPVCHRAAKRLETAAGMRNRQFAAVIHASAYTTPQPNLPPQKLRCAPRAFASPNWIDFLARDWQHCFLKRFL